jgi:hypothetical protein
MQGAIHASYLEKTTRRGSIEQERRANGHESCDGIGAGGDELGSELQS